MILSVILAIVVLAVLLFVWGVARIRKGNSQSTEAIRNLRTEDIPALVIEGKEGLQKAYGITIDMSDRETAAKILDSLFEDHMKLKDAFQKDDFYWYFVLPVGALIGEFISTHAKGVWKQEAEGPLMEIPLPNGSATCYPFDKVLKQISQGEKKDLYAFLLTSTMIPSTGKTSDD